MKINETKIQHLANLARLNISEKEMKLMFSDFEKILDFIQQLDGINTDNVQPLIHIHEQTNIYRKDVVVKEVVKKMILKRASCQNSDYIKVPKIITES